MWNHVANCLKKDCSTCVDLTSNDHIECKLEEKLYIEQEPFSVQREMYYKVKAKFELFKAQGKELTLGVPELIVLRNRYQ